MKENNRFLPLYKDLMFKGIFGNNKNVRFATSMIEAMLNLKKGSLDGSVIYNSIVLNKKIVDTKSFELDILLKTPNGDIINLEMQHKYNFNAEVKNFMYMSRIFGNQLSIGNTYQDVKPTIQINFVKDLRVLNIGAVINEFTVTSRKDPDSLMLGEYFRIFIVDVDCMDDKCYNYDSEFESFRRLIGAETYEEAEEVVKRSNNPLIEELFGEMIRFMNKDYVQNYDWQEMFIRSEIKDARLEGLSEGLSEGHASGIKEGRVDGIAEGIIKGELNKQLEIAKNLIKNTNISLEEISLCTGLSLSKVEKLQEELKEDK